MSDDILTCPPSTSPGNVSMLPPLPGIDREVGLHMCNCDHSFYEGLLHKFRTSKRESLNEIRALLADGNIDGAGRMAHSMKSVAATLGASDLSLAARLLEEAITERIDDQMEARMAQYAQALHFVINGLDATYAGTEMLSAMPAITPVPQVCETILLAEDDRMQMELTTNILESSGYKVLKAHDGVEAVELFTQYQDNIDLVIMDALMPKMTGKRAWDEINSIRPGVKACFVSGYTNEISGGKLAVDYSLPFLSKPVMPATLLRTVREILDSASSTP